MAEAAGGALCAGASCAAATAVKRNKPRTQRLIARHDVAMGIRSLATCIFRLITEYRLIAEPARPAGTSS